MSASRAIGFLTGASMFIVGFVLLFTLVGALFGVILMGEGLNLIALSRVYRSKRRSVTPAVAVRR